MICKPLATVTAGSFLPLTLRFYAEGDSQTPTAVYYTLSDSDGAIINSKDDEPATIDGNVLYLGLEGDDLPNYTSEQVPIYLEIKYTYDSDTYGEGKTVVNQSTIYIDPLNYQESE